MSNYTKSFNFRNGVQVDDSNFIVNAVGLVGIGTTKPEKLLDVFGNARISGVSSLTSVDVSNNVSVGTTIVLDSVSGIVTAVRFVGDASGLTNIVAIATDGWVANTGTLSTVAKIGIGTMFPTNQLDVKGDAQFVGLTTFDGSIKVTGVSTFAGLTTVTGHTLFSKQLQLSGISTFIGITTQKSTLFTNQLSASGVSTFYAAIDANNGATIDNVQIGISSDNEIDTINGDLILDSQSGLTIVDDNLKISGIVSATDFTGLATGTSANLPNGFISGSSTATSLTVTGISSFIDDLNVHQQKKVKFFDSNDLVSRGSISMSATNGWEYLISDSAPGDGFLFSVSGSGNHTLAKFIRNQSASANSGVELYNKDEKKLETVGVGVSVYNQLNVASFSGLSTNFGALRYGDGTGAAPYSTRKSLDLINTDTGNVNFYIDSGNTGGDDVGDFHWHKGFSSGTFMTLTGIGGSLGIGLTNPEFKLHVQGTAKITDSTEFGNGINVSGGDATVQNNLTVQKGITANKVSANFEGNLHSETGITTVANLIVKNFGAGTGFATMSSLDSGAIAVNAETSDYGSNYLTIGINPTNNVFVTDVGTVGIRTMTIPDGVGVAAATVPATFFSIGVGTNRFGRNTAVDFVNAGTSTSRYMVPPTVADDTAQGELTGNQSNTASIPRGAIIYNAAQGQHRYWNGTTWKTLGDYT